MSPADRMTVVRAKIERAQEHLGKLESEVRAFLQTNPYQAVGEDDPETGDWRVLVRVREEPPLRWSATIGDVIHNLRSSLDLLVWQLVIANGGEPNEFTGFPIFKSADEFEKHSPGRLKGASEEAVRLMKELKSYQGGNNTLWQLHQLDIIDKHRLLIPVGSAHRNVVIDMSKGLRQTSPGWDIPPMPIALEPSDRQFPLKDGAEIFRVKAQARGRGDMDPKFTFEIAFGEGEIIDGEPLVPTLSKFVDVVAKLTEKFMPFLIIPKP